MRRAFVEGWWSEAELQQRMHGAAGFRDAGGERRRFAGMYWNDLGWQPSGSNRVIRGGSWNNNGRNCRSANRNNNNPSNRNNNIGFRVVLAPAQPSAPEGALADPAAIPSCAKD